MTAIRITEDKGYAIIKPAGYLGPELFQAFRAAIEGSKFDFERKVNVASVDKLPTILQRLRESKFDTELCEKMADRLKSHTAQMWIDLQGAQERLTKIDEDLATRGMKLYPFQRSGVQWLATKNGALLADEMGLGKTIQAICALPAGAPVLIVAPAVAKGVWRREIKKSRPHLMATILEGKASFRWPKAGEVLVVNYDILPDGHKKTSKMVKGKLKEVRACDKSCKGCLPFLTENIPGTVVIADEAHALKNSKAQRTIKFRAISESVRANGGRTWLLTATPLLNRPPELWSVYQAAGIAQEAFGSWKQFLDVFNGRPGHWGGFEWGTPLAEVGERIRRVCLRRLRTEVMPELPTKTWREITVNVDRKALKKCDELLAEHGGIEKIVALVEKGKLDFENLSSVRHALALSKIPALLDMVEDFEEQDEPIVVFSAHRAVVEELKKRPGWRVIMGGVPPNERSEIEDSFQRGELKGIACTIAAGGVAITLTRSHNAIFTDREWTPALNAQAEDRICRIGQTRGCVITTLQADHPLDERITELLLQKQRLIEGSVDAARVVEVRPEDGIINAEYEAMVKAAEEEVRIASEPKPKKGEKPKDARFRDPANPQEVWAARSLLTLADLDPDGASEENGVGFNKFDGSIGHSLAKCLVEKNGLTNAQYKLAIEMCKKYRRQIGECPKEVE